MGVDVAELVDAGWWWCADDVIRPEPEPEVSSEDEPVPVRTLGMGEGGGWKAAPLPDTKAAGGLEPLPPWLA